MCTVLLRFAPGQPWPLLLAAVRDEFVGRPWDPPATHWPAQPTVAGGRDRVGGGTWLAVDRSRAAVAALLNGVRRPAPDDGGVRPTRGTLTLGALGPGSLGSDSLGPDALGSDASASGPVPGIADLARLSGYDGFHLIRADRATVEIWSWDGADLEHRQLAPGDTIIVNLGPDRDDDPLVPFFRPLLRALPSVDPRPGLSPEDAWDGWIDLLRGAGLAPTDPRGLIIEHHTAGGAYGSTSASLVGIRSDGVTRYDFTASPASPHWYEVPA